MIAENEAQPSFSEGSPASQAKTRKRLVKANVSFIDVKRSGRN